MDIDVSRINTASTKEVHKATATVGRDTIEAEYFVFKHSNFWEPKEESFF